MSNCFALHDQPPPPRSRSGRSDGPRSARQKSSSPRRTPRSGRNPLFGNALRPPAGRGRRAVGLGLLLALAACSAGGPRPAPSPLPGSPSTRTRADWDDVRASVAGALGECDLVLVRLDTPRPGLLVYTLRSSRDEPAVLTVRRLDQEPDPVGLELTCSIGRFGDPERERDFLRLVADRLGQLRGVEVAPIRR